MKLQQTVVLISTCIYILILILGTRKSNTAVVSKEKKPFETWAIIGREYVEYTQEEAEWRARYVK